MKSNYEAIWNQVTKQFQCNVNSIHGPNHWRRVEQNALKIAASNGANLDVVRLFAVFHDSRREHDLLDFQHGERGAEFAASLRGYLFDLSDELFDLLEYACAWHAHGHTSQDPTIAACWDADRLDLTRIGAVPKAHYMSTELGAQLSSKFQLQNNKTSKKNMSREI